MVVRAMTYQGLIHGGLTNTNGSCPGCGADVPRVHQWSPANAKDAYRCPTCGIFEYATRGGHLPLHDRVKPVSDEACFQRAETTLATVLDAADCVG